MIVKISKQNIFEEQGNSVSHLRIHSCFKYDVDLYVHTLRGGTDAKVSCSVVVIF